MEFTTHRTMDAKLQQLQFFQWFFRSVSLHWLQLLFTNVGVIFHGWNVVLWAWLLQGVQDFVARSVAARPHALKLPSLTFKNLWGATCSKSTFLIAKIITLSLPQSKWASSSSVCNLCFWRFSVNTFKG